MRTTGGERLLAERQERAGKRTFNGWRASTSAPALLTGDEFGASEAHRMGLVQEVTAPGEEFAVALGIAERIARQAPLGVRATLASARLALAEGEAEAARHLLPDLQPANGQRGRQGRRGLLPRAPRGELRRSLAAAAVRRGLRSSSCCAASRRPPPSAASSVSPTMS
jgi:enoyl-CoA hydratase/carnithine racemase